MIPISFWRGRHLYQIGPAREGAGFIGLCSVRSLRRRRIRPALCAP